jgi:hypothetical protein
MMGRLESRWRTGRTLEARPQIRTALVTVALTIVLVGGGLLAVMVFWPMGRVTASGGALARVEIAPLGERVSEAAVVTRSGQWVKASVHSGFVEPAFRLAAGSRVTVEVTVRRAGWLGWLVGSTAHLQAVIKTPATHPSVREVYPAAGRPVVVSFGAPVAAISVQFGASRRRLLRYSPARATVPIGVEASGVNSAGTALVSGVECSWERFPSPVRINWFPKTQGPELLVRPAKNTTLAPTAPIVLTFSHPVSRVLGTRRPSIWPPTPGVWDKPNNYTLVFQPSGLGFPLGSRIHLGLTRPLRVLSSADPATLRTLSWSVPAGSPRRLEQLLAQLGYLPLAWHPSGNSPPRTASALARAALAPLAGTLTLRYRIPPALEQLWKSPAGRPVLLRGAVMAFESAHRLTTDGVPGPAVWRALLTDAIAGTTSPLGYSYVYVSETIPETLTLWHNGRLILHTAVNTGITAAPTALGTYPVYLHLASTTMSGTNPNGTHYSDPGVPWVNYFNGGDAVHGFVRPGYGYPQSLGCVEAPIPTAAKIWPYLHVGTLVTVAN